MFFLSFNEGTPREAKYFHATSAEDVAKFWLTLTVYLPDTDSFDTGTIRELMAVVTTNQELIEEFEMNTSPNSIRFNRHALWVDLSECRTMDEPLTWFSRLLAAAANQRAQLGISQDDLHGNALDQHVTVSVLLADQTDLSKGDAHHHA